jgi:hypothetical protein
MKTAGMWQPILRCTEAFLLFAGFCVPVVYGQQPEVTQSTAPPPLKVITRLERDQLDATDDLKSRLKKTIEFSEAHLANAEAQTAEQAYDKAAAEAGKYWALIEDALNSMKALNQNSDKARDLYKRLELALRAHGPRLSAIRRITPSEYAAGLKEIEDFARSGRTQALNSFYGDTVVRDSQKKPSGQKDEPKPEKTSRTPEAKQP